MVSNIAAITGPRMMPTGPKESIPPRIDISITRSGNFESLPTIHGRKKLSTNPTANTPHTTSPIPHPVLPINRRYTAAGNQINGAPSPGMAERRKTTLPQNAAPSIPIVQNANPTSTP